ncbi:WD repeat and SOCS box-containing protein 1-like [Actinia tenebrosa]|uniref:WD repeat and SOCS box-containing protein 1-like n=1 Tax=Actinia tenebrosa TaxID=6105 RepID=A0A6P8H3E0_ACTTE|nr:WD repeat and SOCS box-containing protein 1-like [Actinia tenebrosa]
MDVDVQKNTNTRLLSEDVYRPLRSKGQSYAAPCTIIQHLNHTLGNHQGLLVSACNFAVHDDSILITQTTFPGSNTAHTFKAGFVQSWDLTEDSETGHDDSLFTYAPRPEFSLSPNEGIISSILNSGKGVLILAEIDDDSTLEPCKFECVSKFGSDNLSAKIISCVFSPDGRLVVTISVVLFNALLGQQYHDMCLWRLGKARVLQKCSKIRCENHLSGFSGEPQSCIFSPDSSLLALSTTDSQLYVLRSNRLEVFAVIRSTRTLGNNCMCAFDPCESLTKLNIGLSDGLFQVWRLIPGNIDCVFEERILSSSADRLTSMAYTLDHSLLAFGTTAGDIIIYETELYIQLYKLNPNDAVDVDNLQVCSIAFAKSCQELAVGYDDGCVRLWQLPVKMNLQHMCRLEIIQLLPENMIYRLPLPEPLRAYLMFKVSFAVDSSDD